MRARRRRGPIPLLLCAAVSAFCCAMLADAAANDVAPWLTSHAPWPSPEDIYRNRILPVARSMIAEATELLEKTSVVPLTFDQAVRLAPAGMMEPDRMLAAEIEQREKRAEELEGMSRSRGDKLNSMATEQRTHIEAAKRLIGTLKPYLVRGVEGSEHTGGFSACYSNGELWITHSSLGTSRADLTRRPVVVFLPDQPHRVHVSASVAR